MADPTPQDHERARAIAHACYWQCKGERDGHPHAEYCNKATAAIAAALSGERERLQDACDEFRDSVLNSRHQLAETIEDPDQINAILDLYDDTIGNEFSAIRKGE